MHHHDVATMMLLRAALLLSMLASQYSYVKTMTIESKRQKALAVSRRRTLFSLASGAFSSVAMQSQPALAVKERNEALCKTGFFTNIGAWYCTDIGDISDEGVAGSLSKTQDETADSLMSKLGLSDEATKENDNDSTENKSQEIKHKQ